MSPPMFDEQQWRTKVLSADPALLYAPHFKEGKFFNPWMPEKDRGFLKLLRWRLLPRPEYSALERCYLPEVSDTAYEKVSSAPKGDFILWIGHATFLIRINGQYWLTDPMFSERALIPRRKTPPALTVKQIKDLIPRLNVIISHNHYDHLDRHSLQELPHASNIFVPLGLGEYVREMNKGTVTEMDWWQNISCGDGITLVCLPMQHWSRRLGQGHNETLWASFLLITPTVKIYFGGDTGYFIGYREIGRKYAGIDYAVLPITAYHPRWFMHYAHMNVDEAIEAFKDLGARFMIPQQWGTFHLGDDPVGYAALELKRKIAGSNHDPSRILILDIGELHFLETTEIDLGYNSSISGR
ncbi:MAG: MBL fold metallo-hydrolase [Deltaproteobacteria bacterium]|nr:MBL fold metallo-hydrolase [Deltaproteobacteria bacterium]